MIGTSALDTILESGSSDEEILLALAELELAKLDLQTLNQAVEKIRATADCGADIIHDLAELGRFSLDCAGTGGSGVEHFNISTSIAFVLASAGFKVAKFGGRAASGKSGSFDFLECLGLSSQLFLHDCADALSLCGVAFIFAPQVYPGLKRLVPLRKKFGKPTILNYVGPLLNPLRPSSRLMGVSSDHAHDLVAQHLRDDKKTRKAMLVTSGGRLDEFSIDEINNVSLIENDKIHQFQLNFQSSAVSNLAATTLKLRRMDMPIKSKLRGETLNEGSQAELNGAGSGNAGSRSELNEDGSRNAGSPSELNEDGSRNAGSPSELHEAESRNPRSQTEVQGLRPGNAISQNEVKIIELDAKTNAQIFLDIVEGQDTKSPHYHMLLLNAGAGFHLLKACSSIDEGIGMAAALIEDGTVAECLATCRRFYARLSR